MRCDLVNESESVPRGEFGDFTPVFIPALERPYFAVCYPQMSGCRLERVLANLGEDLFAEGRWLAEQNGFEVKGAMIRTAMLDP